MAISLAVLERPAKRRHLYDDKRRAKVVLLSHPQNDFSILFIELNHHEPE